jgi:hypothetical protein
MLAGTSRRARFAATTVEDTVK